MVKTSTQTQPPPQWDTVNQRFGWIKGQKDPNAHFLGSDQGKPAEAPSVD